MLSTGPFRIDLADERLWRGSDAIALRPKTWAVLRHLVERAGRLVTKQELLDAVWSGVAVEEKVLNASIAEIRSALGDDARAPRYVETIARRGFRFIAPLSRAETDAAPSDAAPERPAPRPAAGHRTPFVGRDRELALLDRDRGWRSRLLTEHLALPSSVVEVLERRLRRLSPACVRLLDVAALIGD
ncbi:MAG: winged helix-turn-helix domain-containing protein, partial [Thermodesulfobacteriota bacterium]